MIALAIMALVLAAVSGRAAGDLSADFGAANKLYAEGKFAEAGAAYNHLIQQTETEHAASAALFFNDGNAEFKQNHLGKAIAAYRQAALLAPRDPQISSNLEYARNQVQGVSVRPSWWQTMIGTLTLNEGSVIAAAAFWLTLGLLALKQYRPALAPKLREITLLAAGATVVCGAILAAQLHARFSLPTAVVIQANALARSGPFDEAQTLFPVHDGAELPVVDRHGDWFQVADGTGKTGWLPRQQLALLRGA